MHFSMKQRFKILEDGTIYASAGVQTNCAGVAGVHFRISLCETQGLQFIPCDDPSWDGDEYGKSVPGIRVPPDLIAATQKGCEQAYQESGLASGIIVEFLDAFVHVVDARATKFKEAALRCVKEWIQMTRTDQNK